MQRELMYREYTLKTHLEALCNEHKQYKYLSASLELDKIEISKILSEIIYNTPHYSQHEISHSESILNKIEMLLGEDRIKKLGPTETWLIIMSAYTHDLGMVIFGEKIGEDWIKEEFQEFIKENSLNSYDSDLKIACKLISNFNLNEFKGNEEWPLKVKQSVNLIVSEFYRRNHASNSRDYIVKSTLDSREHIFLTSNININKRLMGLLGDIALSHSFNFEVLTDIFPYQTNGCETDKVHPRFISCLLRLGDLLDLDNNRFNKYNEALIGKLPKSSQIHKQKHESITHFLINPKKIEICGDCEDTKVYRELRGWIDYLESEVKNLSLNWNIIAPKDFGVPPRIGEITLKIKGSEELTKQANLRFGVDINKAFEIIEGSGIYENNFIFIRELIQNSLDSTKIQIWKDLKDGLYDGILEEKGISLEEIQNSPYNMPNVILKNYPINIKLKLKEKFEEDYYLEFEISDRGTGINNEDIKRICNVGSSYKGDKKLVKIVEELPFYLKPTAAFGLGLQSCFIVTDKIDIKTKADGEEAKFIEMESRQKNGYITVQRIHNYIKRGSIFNVKVNRKNIEEIPLENVNYDQFSEENIYLKFLEIQIKKIISEVRLFNFKIQINEEKEEIYYNNPFSKVEFEGRKKLNDDLFVDKNKKELKIHIIEKQHGAFVTLTPSQANYKKNIFLVRGMKIGNAFNRRYNPHFNVTIDILSEKSDKLLGISRSIPKNGEDFGLLLDKIYHNAYQYFMESLKNIQSTERTEIMSFNNEIDSLLDYEFKIFFEDNDLNLFSTQRESTTQKIECFEIDKYMEKNVSEIYNIDTIITYETVKIDQDNKKFYNAKEEIKEMPYNNFFFIKSSNFRRYISIFFEKEEEFYLHEYIFKVFKRKKNKNKSETNINKILKYLKRSEPYHHSFNDDIINISYRPSMWVMKDNLGYNNIKIQDHKYHKYEATFDNEKKLCMLYSPFFFKNEAWNDKKLLENLVSNKIRLQKISLELKKVETKKEIRKEIENLLNPRLIKHILKYSIEPEVTEKDIKEAYIDLIAEYYLEHHKEIYLSSEFLSVTINGKNMVLKDEYLWEKRSFIRSFDFDLLDEKNEKIEYIISNNSIEKGEFCKITFNEKEKKLSLEKDYSQY